MQRMTQRIAPLATTIAMILTAVSGLASEIGGLYRTGVSDDGSLAPANAPDNHYALVSTPSGGPGTAWMPLPSTIPTAYPFPEGWIIVSNARWLAPAANASQDEPAGAYIYRLTFLLADACGNPLDPATASISGSWAVDNQGVVLLNGMPVTTNWGFTALSTFTVGSGFLVGTNYLDFVVANVAAANPNPTGLLVAELSGSALSAEQVMSVHADAYPAVEIRWQSEACRLYQIQRATGLSPADWSDFGQPTSGNGDVMSVFDNTRDGQQRFYRVLKLR